MRFSRASGVLLHPTSLPGPFGIGGLGSEAHAFVDLLASAGQTYWQVLPIGPTGYGDSPYQSFSAFAGNTLLISPEKLVEDGLLDTMQLNDRPVFSAEKVDFGAVYDWKNKVLTLAYQGFLSKNIVNISSEFQAFCGDNGSWLDDYALYRALKLQQDHKPWYEWPDKFKHRDQRTVRIATDQLRDRIQAEKFHQFLFFRQWSALRRHANQSGIKFIGDIPIFVALDSADVWANQDKFKLNSDGTAKVVAGVPPDFFSATGQLWGNPIYDWDAMRSDGFNWWISRFRAALEAVDMVRIDHFRGFAAAWEVNAMDETAENGTWVEVPGRELFAQLRNELGDLPVIAEDLGEITSDVTALRDEFDFPGMKVLQFAFGGDAANSHLPHNYAVNSVVYTATHDNDTTVGWWASLAADTNEGSMNAREHCLKYLNSDGSQINWDFVRTAWSSVAEIAIAPAQDLLGLGSEARMNTPATASGNWAWRMPENAITPDIASTLREMTELFGRLPTDP